MKIIVCFCIQRQLEDSEISYTVSKTFHCQCQPNRHGFFLLFLVTNTSCLNVFLAAVVLFLIVNISNLDRLNIVKSVVK